MFLKALLNILYPNVCGICGKPIKNDMSTCLNCLSILKYVKEKIIRGKNEMSFDYVVSLFPYEGIIRKQILNYKFCTKTYIKYSFAELITNKLQSLPVEFDLIIPVPISMKRFRERGFNQSYEIAKEISKMMQKPIEARVLKKSKNNDRQSNLSKSQRKENVKGVYCVKNEKRIQNRSILLVDDIYTTGATVNECSKVLKEKGASKVIVVTIAYAK